MPRVLLALGSNLGNRRAILDAAVAAIGELPATQVLVRSTWHATKPIGGPAGQGEFLNGAVLIDTEIVPAELHRALQQIEQRLGRERIERWAARTLDIDILLYDDQVIDEPDLQIPHPRMSFRPFVLAPAAEIVAEMVHPMLGVTIGALWHHLQHARDEVVVCGGVDGDRLLLINGLLRMYSAFEREPSNDPTPMLQALENGLRIEQGILVANTSKPDWLKLNRNQMQKQSQMDLPKLQVYLQLSLDCLAERVEEFGSKSNRESFDCLKNQTAAPNPMSRLFTGVPTLILDPRDDPFRLRTEAAAALEAIWPDLCRPGA